MDVPILQLFAGESLMTYRIKNWGKHQHFKDRTPPWIKLYRDILDDPDWHELPGDSAKVLISLWLIASEDETHTGALPDERRMAFRLRISEAKLKQELTKLSHWLMCDDIATISQRYQSDAPETDTETETEKKAATKSAAISLQSFLDSLNGARAIDSDDPIFAYCEKCGISEEMLNLCWLKFKDYYLENPSKKYKDWRKTFRNCVKDNWYGIWWFNADNKAELSNKGRQAAVSFKEAA